MVLRSHPRVVCLAAAVFLMAGCGSTVASQGAAPLNQGLSGAEGTTEASRSVGSGLSGGAGRTPVGTAGGTSSGTGSQLPGTSSPPNGTRQSAPPSSGASSGASGRAVTRNTAPITVGIVITATSNADQFGVSMGNTLSEENIDRKLIDALNARGGLNGRRIVPVFASTDTGSNNWETDFAAACATFTQDNKVEAVLGYVFTYFSSFESCLAKKAIPHLNTGFNIPDAHELRPFPLHVALDVPTIDRRSLTKLEMAAADGVLTAKSRIGVVRDSCPGSARSYDQVFLPAAKRLGLNVVKSVELNCANGNSDSGAAVQALQNAVLQFASNKVDQVLFHAASEGPALLLFSVSAESQGFRPGYIVTSLANLEALKGYLPAAQRAKVNGYGWLPTQDVPPQSYPRPNAAQARCLGLLSSQGVKPVAGPDYFYAYNICEAFFAYEQALARTHGSSRGTDVVAAVKGLGTSFVSVTNDGGSAFSPAWPDAPRAARHASYADSCGCFRYVGAARMIPSS